MKKLKINNRYRIISIIILIIAGINILSSVKFFRIDLTSEKKYTLSEKSKNIVKTLSDPVYFHIYLAGDLPISFKRLQRSTLEILDELKAYNKKNIQFKLVNLNDIKDQKERQSIFTDLAEKGIQPTNINIRDKEGGYIQKIVLPGVLATFNGKEVIINILENNPTLSGDENLNQSIENLEYKFTEAIYRLTIDEKEKIAFIEGHGELNEYEVADITRELAEQYQIDRVTINGINKILNPYSLVIIAKPLMPYNEKDKFIIDQYLMDGGKICWFLENGEVFSDSLAKYGQTICIPTDVNLSDQLFRYGIRINPVLLNDLQCALIPINTSLPGQPSKFVPAPWLYFPLLNGNPKHPITKNLNLVKAEYINTIDTVGESSGQKKTVLLRSSMYSKLKSIPSQISLSEVMEENNDQEFNNKFLPLAVLIEGKFESVFKNRMLNDFIKDKTEYKELSDNSKMVIIADGDIIKNNVRQKPDGIMIEPLGYDRYTNQTYGNKDFIINLINYMVEDNGLIELRSRSIELRLLDKQKVNKYRIIIQLVNIIIPVVLIIIFGILYSIYRQKKYAK
ncbi:gliding motility-associated ABC transporter substrate-binding protein GldG [Bacteroidota bacterium]